MLTALRTIPVNMILVCITVGTSVTYCPYCSPGLKSEVDYFGVVVIAGWYHNYYVLFHFLYQIQSFHG